MAAAQQAQTQSQRPRRAGLPWAEEATMLLELALDASLLSGVIEALKTDKAVPRE